MRCPRCQFENPENSLFCGDCDAPLMMAAFDTIDYPMSK